MDVTKLQLALLLAGLVLVSVFTDGGLLPGSVGLLAWIAFALVVIVPCWAIGPTITLYARKFNVSIPTLIACSLALLVVLATTTRVGSPSMTYDGVAPYFNLTSYGYGFALAVGGLLGLPIMVGNLRYYRGLRNATAAGAAEDGDPVVACGTVRTLDAEGRADRDERTVCSQTVIRRRGGGRLRAADQYVSGHRRAATDFYLRAESKPERLLVTPKQVSLEFDADNSTLADDGTTDATDSDGSDDQAGLERSRIVTGETACVVGKAVTVSGAEYPDSPVVGADGSPVLIADGSREETMRTLQLRVYGGGFFGLVVTPLGYLLMLVGTL